MASVDWAKTKGGGEAKAKFRHTTKDYRATHEHSNKHIDTQLTHRNTSLSGLRGHELGYAEMCAKYDDRIAELDAMSGANKRKDRVTMLSLEVPLPMGVGDWQSDQWFLRVADLVEERFGASNVIDMHIDRDEVHDYIDAKTGEKRRSRIHAVAYVVPELDGRLCAKRLMTKRNMRGLNNAIDKMSEAEFGCSFMTGEREKSTDTVEELKAKSSLAELLALEARERAIEEARRGVEQRWREIEDEKAQVDALKSKIEARESAVKERERVVGRREVKVAQREAAVAEREVAVGRTESAVRAASSQVRASGARRMPHAPSV